MTERVSASLDRPFDKKRAHAKGLASNTATRSQKTDMRVTKLVSQVSSARLQKSLGDLTAFPTRYSYSKDIDKVSSWIDRALMQQGYTAKETFFQRFPLPKREGSSIRQGSNVLCAASSRRSPFVLLCAHYDSRSRTHRKSLERAPGGDDNASGIAVLLETARIMKSVKTKRGVVYAAFGAEEQSYTGAWHCVARAVKERWPIDVVINLDMVGYQHPKRPFSIVVEYDQNKKNGNDAASKKFGLLMARMAADHTSLKIKYDDISSSDYVPFEKKGYPCVGLYDEGEDADPRFKHTTKDTYDKVNPKKLAEVARLAVATVASVVL